MDARSLAVADAKPLDIPADRLYRIASDRLHDLVAHSLIVDRDRIVHIAGRAVGRITVTNLLP